MAARRDPERTLGLAFLALAAAVAIAAGAGLWAAREAGEGARAAAIWSGAGFLLLLAIGAAWLWLRRRLIGPLLTMSRDLELAAHAGAAAEPAPWAVLGRIGEGGRILLERHAALRAETQRSVDAAGRRLEQQKRRLEAILLDLAEGVLVCSLDHHILLYNRAAMRLLGLAEEIGLGRSLFGLIAREPILHTIEVLTAQAAGEEPGDRDGASLVAATIDARHLLRGRIGLIAGAGGAPEAYVLTFADISAEIEDLARRDALLREASEGLRGPVANIRAIAETLQSVPPADSALRGSFETSLAQESLRLSETVEALAARYRALTVGQWPMDDVYSADLIGCAAQHLRARTGIALTAIGIPLWLRADSHSVMLALEHVVTKLASRTGLQEFDIEALLADRRIYLDLRWSGASLSTGDIESWLDDPLPGALGGSTTRQVLERHGSEIWSFAQKSGAALRFPLPAPQRAQFRARRTALPPRPEFYDFDLGARAAATREKERPLAELDYVVFDTETTGLRPDQGDEIVAIGAVRIVNRRLLTGETFERIVNPGRPIPPASTRFHGIDDAAVEGKPPITVILPQFRAFARNAVLIAHNAAFDISFLLKHEVAAGVRFEGPVLDTLLLAGTVLDHLPEHSLDSVAERFGIRITQRHTALADAMTTASLFLKLLDVLEGRGIRTLGEAMSASGGIAALRRTRLQA